jgi:pimeloyl-ACP methyl ester carboxylesterase
VEALTRWVDAGAVRLFVREWGEPGARPVLFWHGLGGTSAQMEEAGPVLARDYGLRVIAPDAPGCGRSPALGREAYLSDALAELVVAILDALAVDHATFIGFSWGGTVGCYVAASHRARLDALVLLDGGYLDVADFPWVDASRLRDDASDVSQAVVWAGIETPPSAVLDRLSADLPVLLVAATEPASMEGLRESRLERFRAAVPQADVRLLVGVSHDVLGDVSADAARLIGDWLRRA